MQTIGKYESPLGRMVIACDEAGLVGLWFEGQKYFGATLEEDVIEEENEKIAEVRKWLDLYFSGQEPDWLPKLHFSGSRFRVEVYQALLEIPYGQTTTYGRLAKRIARELNKPTMSAQAVGGAVGHNPISILIPCHRVLGTNGSLTGYAGGVDRKQKLLELERKSEFFEK